MVTSLNKAMHAQIAELLTLPCFRVAQLPVQSIMPTSDHLSPSRLLTR